MPASASPTRSKRDKTRQAQQHRRGWRNGKRDAALRLGTKLADQPRQLQRRRQTLHVYHQHHRACTKASQPCSPALARISALKRGKSAITRQRRGRPGSGGGCGSLSSACGTMLPRRLCRRLSCLPGRGGLRREEVALMPSSRCLAACDCYCCRRRPSPPRVRSIGRHRTSSAWLHIAGDAYAARAFRFSPVPQDDALLVAT